MRRPHAIFAKMLAATIIFASTTLPQTPLAQDSVLGLDGERLQPDASTEHTHKAPLWAVPHTHGADWERGALPPGNKTVALASVGAVYASLYTWAYFAWYRGRQTNEDLVFRDEGWFEPNSYAGGADKLGHMYSNYVLARGTTAILERGGVRPVPSALLSTGLTLSFFTAIELKDGYHKGFGFSWGDMAFNVAGNALALAMSASPELDEMFSIKVEYLPTDLFIDMLQRDGLVDVGEDYSGQTFMLAYHLASIDALHTHPTLQWMTYMDIAVGFQALNYLPRPISPDALPDQRHFVGVSLNLQHILDETLAPSALPKRYHPLHFVTEYYSPPFLTARPGPWETPTNIWDPVQ